MNNGKSSSENDVLNGSGSTHDAESQVGLGRMVEDGCLALLLVTHLRRIHLLM
jgi:hypothetical protein